MTSPAPALPVSSDLGPAAPLPGDAAASLAPSAGLEAATEPGFGSLGGLAVPREPITPEELVRDTAQRFFTDPELDALAVVSGGRPVGLVTRPRLLLLLARNFGHEVFARKPIARLADAGALVLPAEMPAVEAVSRALARPVAAVYDDVVVVEESGDYRGLLSVRRLVVEQGLALALSIVDREAALARAAELERMDAMRAQLIAHVTHELRSPVNAIAGLAELLRMACEKQSWDKVPERVELIRTSAASLRTIVKNGLDLMKMKAGKMEVAAQRVDLAPLVREVAETARVLLGPKPVRVAVRAPAAGPSVETDAQKVRQILVNLASNAAKFTDEGLVTISLEEEGRGARLAVSDTGIGIRDEDLPNLFVPFGQLEDAGTKRREGTGLGLVITRKLTELLGGRIELHSRYGEGSTFVVHLPPAPPPGGTLVTEMKPAKTILVVDDDEAHLMIAREILEAEGYFVETHHGAFGATEKALALRPDLVLLDVNMPGLSGDRLAGVLQTQRAARASQVLLWSSNDEDTLQHAVKRLGVGGFVCKGDPAALREGVRSLVG